MTDFGPIVVPSDVEESVTLTLKHWFPEYLTELEKRKDLKAGSLKVPTNYTNRNSLDAATGEKIPKVVVISPGLAGTPQMDGGKQLRGTWRVGVGVAVSGNSETEANSRAKIYGAIVRAIILHHPSLDGLAADSSLLDEQYPDMPIVQQNKHYRAASVWFGIEVNNIVTKYAGPKDPPEGFGVVSTVDIKLERA